MGRRKQPLPEQGAAFAVPLAKGHFGVCRVLRQGNARDIKEYGEPVVLVACSAWIGSAVPDPSEPALRSILHRTHHFWRGQPVIFWANDAPPENYAPIGIIPPTPEEKKTSCNTLAGWQICEFSANLQWRWDHDRTALLAEIAREEEEDDEVEEAAPTMTLEQLQKHRFFKEWTDSPSKAAIKASRAIMKQTVAALVELGAKAPKAKRKAVLKGCIEAFNALDEKLDHFIETIEREDICSEFELLVHACGLGDHENLADDWREW